MTPNATWSAMDIVHGITRAQERRENRHGAMRAGSTEDAVQSAEWGCHVLHDAERGTTKERRPRQPRLENGTIEHATGGSSQELRGRVARALSHPRSSVFPRFETG